MNIIQSIKRAIWTKYQTSTLYTVDRIPLYLDHVPASVSYPIIVVYHISSNQTMAMPTTTTPEGWNYCDGRWQMSVFGNDRQHVQLEDIADRLENLYHRQPLVMPVGSDVTHIGTISYNNATSFFDSDLKIWSIKLDLRILAGK